MCGIFGFVGKRSSQVNCIVKLGTQALAHRGPDDEGRAILPLASDAGKCVALASRRLAILDLSPAGHQPIQHESSGTWLVFNGEIYNFQDIRAELQGLGHQFTSTGDTEVLLKAYVQWGEACVEKLVGMFGFAVWDARRERLFLARDRLGEKPLYYCLCPELFVFASEVRALLATGLVARRLDSQGLASYVAFGGPQDPFTIIEGVRSLPAGHTLVWENGKSHVSRYWSLAETASRSPATDSLEEAQKIIRRRLLESISQRLVSDVPLGIFLSGGVDSSSLVALTSEVRSNPPDTFSVTFGDREFCEAEYSNRVAREFGCRHHQIDLDHRELLGEIPGAMASMDQPTLDGINTYVVSKATKRAGITVALSGLGGDELFAGYANFHSVPQMLQFQRYMGWMRPLAEGLRDLRTRSQTNRAAKLIALASHDYYGDHPYFLSRALFLPGAVRALIPGLCGQGSSEAIWSSLSELADMVRRLDAVNQVAVLEGSTYMANTLLRDTDCMSMVHAMEVRTPFLCHTLWEYVLPLAGRMKLDAHLPKPLLLSAVGQRLPEEIYQRRKMGFTLPFQRWLQEGLRQEVEQELLRPDPIDLFPLDAKQVAKVWRDYLAGKTSWARPWALYALKNWVRRNVGGQLENHY